ncbi:PAS domain-containing protein [Thermoanaerobacter siderophilus]|uniref:PAS domain S-box n=1 Tax=Thermoanaerobacter siderophilus SR4 TaxID=880478 RepID=I9KUR5_9THEO|nr:PAS domain S-box protein [Thermoanaerobacter siderophilus]EIW00616.1 PAS domain S-box [Thermoanaerobacter siderophilus SR4]
MSNFVRNMKDFIGKIDKIFILLVFYSIILLFLVKILPTFFIAILALFLIIGSALYWGLVGGIVSPILATFINIISFYVTKQATIRSLIVGSIAYFAIGILLGRFVNIIRNQRAELQESEGRYRDLFEKANDAIFIVNSKGKIQDLNPAACKLLGYTRDELLIKSLTDIISPEDLAKKPIDINRVLNEESITVERNLNTKEGKQVTVEINISKLDNDFLLGIAHDITKIKEAEKQKLKRLHLLEILYNTTQKFSESLNLEKVAYEITRTCVEDLGASFAWIGRAEAGGKVTLLYQYPTEHPYTKDLNVRWDDALEGQVPTGVAIRTGIPQVIEDISADQRFEPWRMKALTEAGFITSAAFPLTTRGHTFGSLNIYSNKKVFWF